MNRIKPDEIVGGYPVFNDREKAEAFCQLERNASNAIAFVSTLSHFLRTADSRAIVVNARPVNNECFA